MLAKIVVVAGSNVIAGGHDSTVKVELLEVYNMALRLRQEVEPTAAIDLNVAMYAQLTDRPYNRFRIFTCHLAKTSRSPPSCVFDMGSTRSA